jgi:hypothetical protein
VDTSLSRYGYRLIDISLATFTRSKTGWTSLLRPLKTLLQNKYGKTGNMNFSTSYKYTTVSKSGREVSARPEAVTPRESGRAFYFNGKNKKRLQELKGHRRKQ